MPPTMAAEPPEVQSIKSMLHIAKLLAIILGILVLLGGIAYGATVAFLSTDCSGYPSYCGSAVAGALVGAVYLVIIGVVALIVYLQMNSIEAKVNEHQYEAAKSQTLIWVVLGLIFGVILGVILLIAWLKFDPLISWQRSQGGAPPPGYAQFAPPLYAPPVAATAPVYAAPPPAAAPPPPPPVAPAAPYCVKCGKPTTYIAQYGRYYCYADNLYA
jgi:hypothetical protein